jgi:perosamine synthetase
VVGDKNETDLGNMLGHNFRLGEIECAIGIEQLKKLPRIIKCRQALAEKLTAGLSNLKGLGLPQVLDDCTHVYYVYPMTIDSSLLGVSRDVIAGQTLTAKNIRIIRPGYGLAPKHFDLLLGRKANQDIKAGTALNWDLV